MTSCSLFSPAKINLSLRILGKRPDGYHELLTEMVMISLGDTMVFRLSDEPRDLLEVSGRPVDGNPDDNLVLRAIRLFREIRGFGGKPSYWKVELEKKIPVGAGLGGGSSNAAAALWAMNILSGNRCPRQDLMEIGGRLGSDVPFFLGEAHAVASGRGERIHPCDPFPGKTLVLWNPLVPLSTSRIYGGLSVPRINSLTDSETLPKISSLLSEDRGGNDLEPVAMSILPIIRKVKDALTAKGSGFSLMSGSGPTVFGFFDEPGQATSASRFLEEQFGGWTGIFETLSSSPFVSP
ncbi:4-(cytidine 5'-diphospho)-2-C-methyl-D-erythritol kinase [Leptospirillum ferriphilum]|uniref:4-diphosphocytidyl-2-C-methyl-D-erythritol kinase n=1 Tax=Leptospirillum ferriphilum TaxID=178606 RepID=A0A1V3SWN5_9BACT|nr:4-(cytidine 5'-diphospho)-2-C-methyl-D-erythritol kinase [Leptospirillum ferriphilum]OOH72676.1 4-(cytidine 5'-diphospho)-2-C-methyl-D-erythritol kinase [Leptospirillum ferriphilum]